MPPIRLSPHEERAIAVRAQVDPRTVRKHLAGRGPRTIAAARIDAAVAELSAEGVTFAPTRVQRSTDSSGTSVASLGLNTDATIAQTVAKVRSLAAEEPSHARVG